MDDVPTAALYQAARQQTPGRSHVSDGAKIAGQLAGVYMQNLIPGRAAVRRFGKRGFNGSSNPIVLREPADNELVVAFG